MGKKNSQAKWMYLGAVVGFVILIAAIFIFGESEVNEHTYKKPQKISTKEVKKENPESIQKLLLAYNWSTDFVKKSLKSPSSASFAGLSEKPNHVKYIGNDTYLITSYVDSQNGFGAMIRSNYTCKIQFKGDKVVCTDLIIE